MLAFVVLGLSTSAHAQNAEQIHRGLSMPTYAQNVEQVQRKLKLEGYDQIEFTRTKVPFRVNVCRKDWRLHLHIDYYGKVTKRTLIGFCHADVSASTDGVSPAVLADEPAAMNENSTSSAAPLGMDKNINDIDCKKYFPATGLTVTVACE